MEIVVINARTGRPILDLEPLITDSPMVGDNTPGLVDFLRGVEAWATETTEAVSLVIGGDPKAPVLTVCGCCGTPYRLDNSVTTEAGKIECMDCNRPASSVWFNGWGGR